MSYCIFSQILNQKSKNKRFKFLGFFFTVSSPSWTVFPTEYFKVKIVQLQIHKIQYIWVEMGSIFGTATPHRRYNPIHIVFLSVHQLRHYLPLVASRIVFVCVHRRLLLCSLLSTMSRPHCLILVKVVVLKLVKVLLRHCGLSFRTEGFQSCVLVPGRSSTQLSGWI